MPLSVFEIFKIGVGPSSSHTMGPMTAAARFLEALKAAPFHPARLEARLHGSLALTGRGHATDRAVILGLMGLRPETLDPDAVEALEAEVRRERRIRPPGLGAIAFDPERDLAFDLGPPLPGHPNGLVLRALDAVGSPRLVRTYYSVGGGFVLTAEELAARAAAPERASSDAEGRCPFPFRTATEMLAMGQASGLPLAAMTRAKEEALGGPGLDARLDRIGAAMDACVERGLGQEGILPGGLGVRRRAKGLLEALLAERGSNRLQPHVATDWLLAYALAVNEENAAGGRVVTAPTNGAAGVVPAVRRYHRDHCLGATEAGVRDLLLVAGAIGGLTKRNASISGAEVGCQGEVGSASAMAAAGLCAALGGTNEQVENAAEIALEHHLGMTCDPAAGLVQVPCIERNAMGAIKAVAAASLALRGDGTHRLPLDGCVEAMRQTGLDMSARYKETSQAGIAVNLPEC